MVEDRRYDYDKDEASEQAPLSEQASSVTDADEHGDEGVAPDPMPPAPALDDNPWLTSLWRPVLITIAAGCLVIAFLAFVRRLFPGLPAGYTQLVTIIGLVTAAIGCASTTYLSQPGQRSNRNAGFRAAELAFILVITRLAIWAATGQWPGLDLLFRPIEALLDGYFIVGLLAVFLAWIMATSMTEDMINMGLRPDDIYLSRTYGDKWQDMARPVYTDRPAILRSFTGRWVIGGLLMVIFAAGSRLDMPEPGFYVPIIGQNIDRVVIVSVIIYFLVGLALISQGQLALMRARWTLQKTPSSPSILRMWPIYALALIMMIGIISALLPLGGTFHLALIFSAIINGAFWLMLQLFGLMLGFLGLIAMLFAGEEPEEPTPTPEPIPEVTIQPPPVTEPPIQVPPWAGGTVFWILAALLIGYAAYIYFGGRGISFAWLRQLWEMIRLRLGTMARSFNEWQASRIQDGADATDGSTGRRRSRLLSWLGYRGLDPDSQIRYYYLTLLEQANEAGHPRRDSETPARFAVRLDDILNRPERSDEGVEKTSDATDGLEADADLQAEERNRADAEAIYSLTDAFIRVRYADRHVDSEEATSMRQLWQRLRRSLRL